MNELELKELFSNTVPIDPVNVINQFAVYSTLKNDVIFGNNIKNPIFCAGTIKTINQNVYNFNNNEFVGYISFNHNLVIEISSKLIFKFPRNENTKLIAFLPYASFAMKLLRLIEPRLGQTILIIGLNFFSKILADLIKLSGSKIFFVEVGESFHENRLSRFVDKISLIKSMENVKEQIHAENLNSILIFSEISNEINDFLINFDTNMKYYINRMLPFDEGFTDPNYIKGIQYPYPYVRWHYRENLKYFIKLVENKIIDLKFLEIEKFTLDSIDKMNKIIANLQKESLLLFELIS